MNTEAIKQQAQKEIEEEDFRLAVLQWKEKIRSKKSIWDQLFPFKIVIIRKGERHD